jgi:hypothetical protein
MINNCFNPACNRELRYLRDGRIVRIDRGSGSGATFVHYWLCGSCYMSYDFSFSADGSVTLSPRPVRPHRAGQRLNLADVRGPERRSFPRKGPAGNIGTTILAS